jgi:hypothetical protein
VVLAVDWIELAIQRGKENSPVQFDHSSTAGLSRIDAVLDKLNQILLLSVQRETLEGAAACQKQLVA